jgi:beta-fructofuranosidase
MTMRPLLHFTAGAGWINDPLGLTYRDGTYHLFFQYLPTASHWAPDCHWGHATSPDLLRWTEQPVALRPGDGDDGCWSGSVVTPGGHDAALFYTSVRQPNLELGRVRRARPADAGWRSWIKEDVVVEAPENLDVTTFRDPFVFRDRDTWRMLVGATRAGGTAVAFGYRSTDLRRWQSTGPLAQRSGSETAAVWTGTLWECIQLLPVDDRHLLVMSVFDRGVPYYIACAVGTYDDGGFQPEGWYRLTYGPAVYAASAYRDDRDRPGLIGWLRGVADADGGWTGAISVPMLLGLDERRHPTVRPHPNVGQGRGDPPADHWPVGAAVDVEWSPRAGSVDTLTIVDGRGAPLAEIRTTDGALTLADSGADADAWTMPWPGGDVRLLLDGPVLEVFCGGALMAAPLNPIHQNVRTSHDQRGTHRSRVLAVRPATG